MTEPAKLWQMDVGDASMAERLRQRVLIELRVVPRAGDGPYIHKPLHAVRAKEIEKGLQRPCGGADSQDHRLALWCALPHRMILWSAILQFEPGPDKDPSRCVTATGRGSDR